MTPEQIQSIDAYLRSRGDVGTLLAIDAVVVRHDLPAGEAIERINELLTEAMKHERT